MILCISAVTLVGVCVCVFRIRKVTQKTGKTASVFGTSSVVHDSKFFIYRLFSLP
jgi:hypothetical protein